MKKKLTLLIFLFPVLLMAQTEFKNGTLSIDFGKKKPKQEDTVQKQQQTVYPSDEEEEDAKPKKEKKQKSAQAQKAAEYDYKKDGIFKGMAHVGINGCQIDGDGYAGYNYLGADIGVGALVRFHKFLSLGVEANYTMKGAKQKLVPSQNPMSAQLYRVEWDYVEIPVSLNIHDNRLVMASLGLSIAAQVRYTERSENGDDQVHNPTGTPPPGGYPNKFDFCAFGMLNFIIAKNFMLGGRFSYSLLRIRDPQHPGLSRLLGEYNNVISLRFGVIMDKTLFKKK